VSRRTRIGLVAAAAVALGACGGDDGGSGRDVPAAAPGEVRTVPSTARPVAPGARELARVAVGEAPCDVVAGGGLVWVSDERGDVVGVDPATDRVARRVRVTGDPCSLAVAGTDLLVPTGAPSVLHVVDLASGRVRLRLRGSRRPCGRPAAAAGSIWWTTDKESNVVTRFDARSGRVEQRFEGVGSIGAGPCDLVAAGEKVWAGSADGTLQSIDPRSGRVGAPLEAGPSPAFGAPLDGGRSLVVANELGGTTTRLDLTTGRVAWRAAAGSGGLAVAGDDVWAVSSSRSTADARPAPLLWRLDARTGATREVLRVGPAGRRSVELESQANPLAGVAVAGGDVWVASRVTRRLHRLDVP
jgi:outer membrane protein assembly factor BamB